MLSYYITNSGQKSCLQYLSKLGGTTDTTSDTETVDVYSRRSSLVSHTEYQQVEMDVSWKLFFCSECSGGEQYQRWPQHWVSHWCGRKWGVSLIKAKNSILTFSRAEIAIKWISCLLLPSPSASMTAWTTSTEVFSTWTCYNKRQRAIYDICYCCIVVVHK